MEDVYVFLFVFSQVKDSKEILSVELYIVFSFG